MPSFLKVCDQVTNWLLSHGAFLPDQTAIIGTIFLKVLDILTTWVFLSYGFTEGNPYASYLIATYGLRFAFVWLTSIATTATLLYVLFFKYATSDLRLIGLVGTNTGLILGLIVPVYNLVNLYLWHVF